MTGTSTLRTILVGMDGSTGAERALAWASSRAAETGATIIATHVLTYTSQLVNDLPPIGMTTWRRSLEKLLTGAWTEPARNAGAHVQTILTDSESAAAGLLALTDSTSADLVVVGAHSHGNLADRILGGTTYRVAHRARTPVVVIPPTGPDRQPHQPTTRPTQLPTDPHRPAAERDLDGLRLLGAAPVCSGHDVPFLRTGPTRSQGLSSPRSRRP